jgi:putative FmdB family regulatory protein
MPTYQYRCLKCKRRFELFMTYREYGVKPVRCPHCASEQVQRRIGRIRVARSDDSRLEDLGDASALQGIEEDPKALGRVMRKMGSELGEDLGPEFGEVVNRLEAGQSPEEIEKAIPELDQNDGAGGLGDGGDDF